MDFQPASIPATSSSPRALLSSLATHVVLLVLLALWFQPRGAGGPDEADRRVAVVLRDAADSQRTIENVANPDPSNAESESANPVDPLAPLPPELELPGPGRTSTPLPPPELDAGQLAESGRTGEANLEQGLTAEDLKLIAADQALLRDREPVGEPATIRVFGSGPLEGRRFVFVLDRSQSMGASGLGVLSRARRELADAVAQLEPYHEFQIVAYHDRCTTLAERRLLPASPENQMAVETFIARLAAFGPTQHEAALVSALTFKPDVVVFLTDGGYPFLNQGQLLSLQALAGNRGGEEGVQIHCIQFGSGPSQTQEHFMRDLARQNHGTFRYVDVSQWGD